MHNHLLLVTIFLPLAFTHIYSVLFTAQDVRNFLSTADGIAQGINWCKSHGITKVYLETFRDNLLVDKAVITNAKEKFFQAGFNISGCVCTSQLGKPSTGWSIASCYTNFSTQQRVQAIFEFTASIFDDIIIDDFYFTDCECNECQAARNAHQVTVGNSQIHYHDSFDESCTGGSVDCEWNDYRRNLMLQVSSLLVLGAGKSVNPNVKITIKFPNWYDMYQDFGYDTLAQSQIFDHIWIGTEFRDYKVDLKPAYFGFFNMRWLGQIPQENLGKKKVGLSKAGGGWFDPFTTSPLTYLEQARLTVLGGARESFLFEYGSLLDNGGKADADLLAQFIPEFLAVADQIESREILGVAAYKPPNSHGGCVANPANNIQCGGEIYVFDFLGMLGIPLRPTREFPSPTDYPSAIFSTHSLKDQDIVTKLTGYINSGNPTLVTDGLVKQLTGKVQFNAPNVFVLPVNGYPPSLIGNPPSTIPTIRSALLRPLNLNFSAVANVSYFPFSDGSWVVENFNDFPVEATVSGTTVAVPSRDWKYFWKTDK